MVFDLMLEQNLIKKGDTIYIQIDFTSNEYYFLILSASVIVNNRSVPLYFIMRNYPKRKDQYDHKKMENSSLKGLKHALSKQYCYVVLADRGFGNDRFLTLCEEVGFEYLIRATPNMKVQCGEQTGIMESTCIKDGAYSLKIIGWKKDMTVYKASNEKGKRYLLSGIKDMDHKKAADIYKDRFKIEKCFQDLKSSGFNMEKSKIRKYSNYKKLWVMVMVEYVLLVILGQVITVKCHFEVCIRAQYCFPEIKDTFVNLTKS